jgi:hypothetical protein
MGTAFFLVLDFSNFFRGYPWVDNNVNLLKNIFRNFFAARNILYIFFFAKTEKIPKNRRKIRKMQGKFLKSLKIKGKWTANYFAHPTSDASGFGPEIAFSRAGTGGDERRLQKIIKNTVK